MKTQHPKGDQCLKDILNIHVLPQLSSIDLMSTKERHHINFISFNVKCPAVYTHTPILTVLK